MSEEEAYKIFSEMTPDVLDYVFCLAKAYTEKDKEIERQKEIIKRLDIKNLELTTIIKEVRKYINKYLQEHIIDEYPDEQSTFYDEEDRFIPNAKTKLLEILDKADKDV